VGALPKTAKACLFGQEAFALLQPHGPPGRFACFGAVMRGGFTVGPCRLTVSNTVLKAPMVSALETKM